MENFTPIGALVGGVLIGGAASAMLYFNGRIAGISGIVAGLFERNPSDLAWRWAFLAGLLTAGLVLAPLLPGQFSGPSSRSLPLVLLAGFVVGIGVRLGSGCTSGHGVCGISRLSIRSLVATVTFIGAGVVTATLLRLGGL